MSRHWLVLLLPLIIAGLLTMAVSFLALHAAATPASRTGDWGGTLPGDTTLQPADNPHVVNSNLIVPAGVTLTVAAGAELYFAPGVSLIVYGRLLAEGTPTQRILFTQRDGGTYWGAISIIDSAADNRITHAVIEYTREGLPSPRSHGVSAYNSRLTLADSTLRYTQASAGVVADWNSTLYLLRNEIHDIQGDAVHPTGGVAVITGNHIYNARWGAYAYEGIEISQMPAHSPALVVDNHIHDVSDDCLDVNDSWVVIKRNRLHHCADKGISIGSAGGVPPGTQAPSATVVNNLVYASEIGVAVKDGSVAGLIHNTIADNGTGLALFEAHDHPGFGGGRATVVNTILWGNDQTVAIDALSTITVSYTDVEGGWPGAGNLDSDPIFRAADDYHLGAGSPAVNTGRDEGITLDLDGQPRPVGQGPDMGAYEQQRRIELSARPGDARIYLVWQVTAVDPALNSYAISYTQGAHGGGWIMGLPTPTLAFTLTHLTNYVWYTVAVEGWDGSDGVLMRSNLAVVMPTDRTIYVPVILRQHQ
jgi:hypothetical protein